MVLHTLDVKRALAFYLNRTKPFRKSSRLFVSLADRSKGSLISNQDSLDGYLDALSLVLNLIIFNHLLGS